MTEHEFAALKADVRVDPEGSVLLLITRPRSSIESLPILRASSALSDADWSLAGQRERAILLVRTGAQSAQTLGLALHSTLCTSTSRAAICDLSPDTYDFDVVWQRVLDVEELLRHRLHSTVVGGLDIRTQGVVGFGSRKVLLEARDMAVELHKQARLMDAGFVLFEGFDSSVKRIDWIVDILRVSHSVEPSWNVIGDLLRIAQDRAQWMFARALFSDIRAEVLALEAANSRPSLIQSGHKSAPWLLSVLELCAKTIYNESVSPDPFDRDTGWWMVKQVSALAEHCDPQTAAGLLKALFLRT